jgi:hypothetical protein
MGQMQSVAGGGIFVPWIEWNRASASCRPIFLAQPRGEIFAPLQILRAMPGETREKLLTRNCVIVTPSASVSSAARRPSSTP